MVTLYIGLVLYVGAIVLFIHKFTLRSASNVIHPYLVSYAFIPSLHIFLILKFEVKFTSILCLAGMAIQVMVSGNNKK